MQENLIPTTDDAVLECGATRFSVQEARELVALFATITESKNVDAFLAGFTDDCVFSTVSFQP